MGASRLVCLLFACRSAVWPTTRRQLEAYLRSGRVRAGLAGGQGPVRAGRTRSLARQDRPASSGSRRSTGSLSTLSESTAIWLVATRSVSLADRRAGAAGGAAMADFDTLIDLITSTIAPETWDEVGGAGAIEPFPTGVFVDAAGIMKRLGPPRDSTLLERRRHVAAADSGNRAVRKRRRLRKVSLVRLEKQLQVRQAFGEQPDRIHAIAGGHVSRSSTCLCIRRPGDIVLAGPAGDWRTDAEGRIVNIETGKPVLQLDDLVVVLRNAIGSRASLAARSSRGRRTWPPPSRLSRRGSDRSVKAVPARRVADQLRPRWVKQDIKVWGIDPRTRAARVLVEADYRMKLVGMGLEEGTLGVASYLDEVKRAGDDPPAMNVLRWWFTLNYSGIRATAARDAFQLMGPGVKVLSENELLTETGDRIHTGKSDELTGGFARSFTKHIDALAAKYPIYAELKNIFDLALVAGLLRSHDLPAQVGWHMTYFADPEGYRVALGPQPKEVESVVNSVTFRKNRFFAGVSGGVSVDTNALVHTQAVRADDYGLMDAARGSATPQVTTLPRDAWWWD